MLILIRLFFLMYPMIILYLFFTLKKDLKNNEDNPIPFSNVYYKYSVYLGLFSFIFLWKSYIDNFFDLIKLIR
jgi:hypothetical protein